MNAILNIYSITLYKQIIVSKKEEHHSPSIPMYVMIHV